MKTNRLLTACLLATTVICAAEIRTVDELHNSLKDQYPDQVAKKPGETTTSAPSERENIVSKVLAERQQKLKGQPAPEIHFTTKDGTQKRLSDLRGKPVVVAFVVGTHMSPAATSCPPHAALRDSMKRNAKRITDSNVHIVMVASRRQNSSRLKEYLNDAPYTGIAVDSETQYRYEWGVYGTPNVFIVDGTGKVAHLPKDITSPPTNRSERLEPALDLINALPPSPPVLPQDRDITDTNGRKLSGTILEKSETAIKYHRKSDGKEIDIEINTLSAADRQFVKGCQAATPLTPTPPKTETP